MAIGDPPPPPARPHCIMVIALLPLCITQTTRIHPGRYLPVFSCVGNALCIKGRKSLFSVWSFIFFKNSLNSEIFVCFSLGKVDKLQYSIVVDINSLFLLIYVCFLL
jgi:hypothetical protein